MFGSSSYGDGDPTTAYGFLETTEDALLVVQATRQGICERIKRRLQQKEQGYIRSGAIFVYDEEEAGVSCSRPGGPEQGPRLQGSGPVDETLRLPPADEEMDR